METCANTFELPQTSYAIKMEGVDICFSNEAAREAYLVLIMSNNLAGKAQSITLLGRLDG